MIELIFVRHGQTDWNLDGRLQGVKDIPLNSTGISEAEDLAANLDMDINSIISSPLKRAYKTAEILNNKFDLHIQVDDRLKERDFGELVGVKACFVETMERSEENGVENLELFRKKIMSFLKSYECLAGGKYLIVTHGGVISTILNTLSEGELTWQNAPIGNCTMTSIQFKNTWTISYYSSSKVNNSHVEYVK